MSEVRALPSVMAVLGPGEAKALWSLLLYRFMRIFQAKTKALEIANLTYLPSENESLIRKHQKFLKNLLIWPKIRSA